MKLKTIELNGSTYAEVSDGKPVYMLDDGSEVPYDAPHNSAAIKRLNAEAKTHREAKEAAEARLKEFEGLDHEAARKALEVVRNLDDKKLIDAGEVEKVRNEAKAGYERQLEEMYKPVVAERDKLKSTLNRERLSVAFSRSKYIADKLAIPADLVQAAFGERFSVSDDGKIIAKDADGNPLYSHARPGEAPDFEEAMDLLVKSYPYRDQILKGTGASGGGAGGNRTSSGGKRQVTRAEFDRLSPTDKATTAREAEIVD